MYFGTWLGGASVKGMRLPVSEMSMCNLKE